MDIPLVFGTLGARGSQTGSGADARAASRALQDSFVAFAKTGDPNHPGLPEWPRYALAQRATMMIDSVPQRADDPRRWQRELFARVPYIQPGTATVAQERSHAPSRRKIPSPARCSEAPPGSRRSNRCQSPSRELQHGASLAAIA
eukprot:gene44806-56836_t